MPISVRLILPKPPSTNAIYRTVGFCVGGKARCRIVLSKSAREYRDAARAAIREQYAGPPLSGRVTLHAAVSMERIGDADNILKLLFDSMQHARVIEDDKHIEAFAVTRRRGEDGVEVWIKATEAD